MDDVAALCPRVIVIDKGVLSYDGKLEALVQRVRPEKRLVLRFSAEVSTERVKELGNVVKHEAAEAVLQIPHDAVNAVVARALAEFPVRDLNVEDPPLEEVMSELFARSRAERNAA
jgi:ABC-2 type transport system ATP-binding protein